MIYSKYAQKLTTTENEFSPFFWFGGTLLLFWGARRIRKGVPDKVIAILERWNRQLDFPLDKQNKQQNIQGVLKKEKKSKATLLKIVMIIL